MKLSSRMAVVGSVAALATLPAVALANPHGHGHSGNGHGNSTSQNNGDNNGSTRSMAEKQCRDMQAKLGKSIFDSTFGTNKNGRNAFGKCVSKQERQDSSDEGSAHASAVQTCRSEESSDQAAFEKKYGTNANGRNAFGKCVSQQAKASEASMESEQVKAEENAAQTCRSEESSDQAAFEKKYGTNANGRNAFGKCVSQHAKAQEHQSTSSGS